MSKVLVLRTCKADMASPSPDAGGFVWPESGPVEAPDWDPSPVCGHGLHGLLWGEGAGAMLYWGAGPRWLVVEVDEDEVVDLGGKVKFPRGVVVHCGDQASATAYVAEHGGAGRSIVGGTATAGAGGTATAGYRGTATAGDRGTATAGVDGTATAGYRGLIVIRRWDGKRYRWHVAEVGPDEPCKPGVAYRVDDEGEFVEVGE